MILKPPPRFATIIPDRRPTVRYHVSLVQAKKAIAYKVGIHTARGGELYEWYNDRWILRYRVEPQTPLVEMPWNTNDTSE